MNINICNDIRQQDPNFIFGAATSNLQIEGNSNRGISIWDETLKNYPTCDHEIHYKEDINMVKNMGLNAYRCSISWSRIMPDGRKINKLRDENNKLHDENIELTKHIAYFLSNKKE